MEQSIDEAKPIEIEIAQACARLQALAFQGYEQENRPRELDVAAALENQGYPRRHCLQLQEGLYGPSLAKARELLPRVLKNDFLAVLVGDRGPGKTQIATWWAAERLKAKQSAGRYVKCVDLFAEIKATWSDGGRRFGTEEDVLRKYRRAPFLVIDELHERGASEWESRVLANLLDHRYDDMLATVIIANLAVEKISEEINPSILSRAAETGGLIVCDWKSYRCQ